MKRICSYLVAFLILILIPGCNNERNEVSVDEPVLMELTQEAASNFAQIALHCIQREYPNKPGHVLNDENELLSPQTLHPAFYGCYDWHSSVHGHWMLVRLLRLFPELPVAGEIRTALGENLSKSNIQKEVDYFHQPSRKSFERTYGWAWLLKLAQELQKFDDPWANAWSQNLQPLADEIVDRYFDFLPRQKYPIRRGVHPNTAFGLAFALDYARAVNHSEFEKFLVQRSMDYFVHDSDGAARWEPDGDDFFSPTLMEADLMRRVLVPSEYGSWLNRFLPDLSNGKPENLLNPADVSDRSDPKIVHLDGLNLSRAWCMMGIVSSLEETNPLRKILYQSAVKHADAALPHIASGNYEGEHWLASFAVYLLSSSVAFSEGS